jgi:hypothetical protein
MVFKLTHILVPLNYFVYIRFQITSQLVVEDETSDEPSNEVFNPAIISFFFKSQYN